MARFGARTVILLLAAITLLSIALRYPLVDHERLNDTYAMRILAVSVQENHRALWTFSPLSYFGYYPASYPSGTPFILVEISDLTSLPIDVAILLMDAFVGASIALGVFMLAREFISRPEYAIIAAFFATVAPRLVDASYWSASARAPFVALAVLTIFLAFRTRLWNRPATYGMCIFLLFGGVAIHHMGVLFVLFGFAYVLSAVGVSMISRLRQNRSYGINAGKTAGAYMTAVGAALIVTLFVFLSSFARDLNYSFGQKPFFDIKPDWLSVLLRIAASYTNQVGLILPFALLGIPIVLARSRVTTETMFIVMLPITFVPLLPNAQYTSMLLSPFIAILGAAVFRSLRILQRRRLLACSFVCLLCASLVLPFFSIARWDLSTDLSGDPIVVDNQYFNDGAYLRQYNGKALIMSNVDLLALRLSATSGTLALGAGVEAALIGDVNASAVRGNLTWAGEEFPRNLYSWFESQQAPEVQLYVLSFVVNGMSYINQSRDWMTSGSYYFNAHSRLLVAIDNDWPSNYVWMWGNFNASLPRQVTNAAWSPSVSGKPVEPISSYILYNSKTTSLFLFEIPIR